MAASTAIIATIEENGGGVILSVMPYESGGMAAIKQRISGKRDGMRQHAASYLRGQLAKAM